MRIPTAIVAATLIFVFSGDLAAQEDGDAPTRVVVSPLVYLRPGSMGSLDAETARRAARAGMRRYVAQMGRDFEYVGISEVERRIRADQNYDDQVRLADGWAEIGLTKYQELDAQAAAGNLREAYGKYREANHHVIAPKTVAEVVMFLALASLERGGDPAAPLQQMQQMITLDPSRVVRRGAFPEEVVQFYESARLTLEREIRDDGPSAHPAESIARAADADVVLYASVLPNPDASVEAVVWRWEADEERYTGVERLRVTSPSAERIAAATNRLASRHVAVLMEPPPQRAGDLEPSSGLSPFSLELNFVYGSYFQFPDVTLEGGAVEDVTPFGNAGGAIGAGFRLTREFSLVAAVQFLSSIRDFDGVTKGGFTTTRFFLGGELGADLGVVRASIAATTEFNSVGTIILCTDADRKRLTSCSTQDKQDPRLLVGANIRPRLGIRIIDSLTLWSGGSSTFYFIPFATNDLNFLTTFESGLTYRF